MPKKVNRKPVRTKGRPRRTPPRANPGAAIEELADNQAVVGTSPVTTASVMGRVPSNGTASAVSPARRSVAAGRRAPVLVVSYDYLRHDLTALAVLAPSMVVLVVVAFFVFH